MNNKIEYWDWITRQDLKDNPDKIFLFGDNEQRSGYKGQAKEMRGMDNSIGIITKRYPSNYASSFLTDKDFNRIKELIDKDFASIPDNIVVVIPTNGLGSGLARLDKTSPLLFEYIRNKIKQLSK